MSLSNGLQPQLIRYDTSIDANVPNQSLKLRACLQRATCCDETNDTVCRAMKTKGMVKVTRGFIPKKIQWHIHTG